MKSLKPLVITLLMASTASFFSIAQHNQLPAQRIVKVGLRDIVKIDAKKLAMAIIKAGWCQSASPVEFAKFLKIMIWMWSHRHNDFSIRHNGYILHGSNPTYQFAYTATQFPLLWKFIPTIRSLHAKYQTLDTPMLKKYKEYADELVLETKEDRPALEKIAHLLQEADINKVIMMPFVPVTQPELIENLKKYLDEHRNELNQDNIKLLETLIDPTKDLPQGWIVDTTYVR